MSDPIDDSFIEEQAIHSVALEKSKAKPFKRYKPAGYCLSCFQDLEGSKLYCNDKCVTTHDKAERHQFKN